MSLHFEQFMTRDIGNFLQIWIFEWSQWSKSNSNFWKKKRWKRLKNMQSTETTFTRYEYHEIGFSSDLLLWLPSCSSKKDTADHGENSKERMKIHETHWNIINAQLFGFFAQPLSPLFRSSPHFARPSFKKNRAHCEAQESRVNFIRKMTVATLCIDWLSYLEPSWRRLWAGFVKSCFLVFSLKQAFSYKRNLFDCPQIWIVASYI